MVRISTPRGPVEITSLCPPDFLERVEVDRGIGNFWYYRAGAPERQKETLISIAADPEARITVACAGPRLLVGYLAAHDNHPLSRWGRYGCTAMYELGALEINRNWRGLGLAIHLVDDFLRDQSLEERIIYTLGFSWHWDLRWAATGHHELDLSAGGMEKWQYRQRLMALWERFGFKEYQTDEEDIASDPANLFAVRIGSRAPAGQVELFHRLLNLELGKRQYRAVKNQA